jgi:glycosyltransferase involved in cell wall biosynthesis
MRILLISGEFPPMQGGVGDYTREIARAFAAQGHEVFVLTSVSLVDAYQDGDPESWHALPAARNWKWGCWRQVLEAVGKVRPDVVNVQYQAAAYDMRSPAINLLPWRLRRASGTPPVVVTYHDLKPPYLFPKAGPLRDGVVRQMARYSDAVVVTNAEDLAVAHRWPFSGSALPSVFLIPIGSNIPVAPPPTFDRAAWRAEQGYSSADFVWAYFGFLNESKGGECLFRALARAPASHHLLMIGDRVGTSDPTNRAYAAHVERLMSEPGVTERVRWTGYLPTEQVSAALLSADIVVLPYRDGISFRRGSLHAALAHGCTVVSTTPRVPLVELREGENIVLVPSDNPEAVCRAALRLQRHPELRRQIGKGAKDLAQQFTWERIAQRMVDEAFQPLLSAQECPAPSDNL